MRLVFTLLAPILAITFVTGCSDSDDGPATPTAVPASATPATIPSPSPTARPEATPTAVPVGDTRTGIEAVDEVIEAVLAKDAAALEALYRFTEAPCTHAQGLGGPPKCFAYQPAPAEGATVDAFPLSVCEPEWRTDVYPLVDSLLLGQPALYAVVALNLDTQLWNEPYMPQPEYGVILEYGGTYQRSGQRAGVFLGVEGEGGVTYQALACGSSPDWFFSEQAEVAYGDGIELIFEGPAYYPYRPGAATAPQGTRTGDAAIDAVIAAVESGDAAALASLFAPRDVPCTWARGLGGPPKCEYAPGQPPRGRLCVSSR